MVYFRENVNSNKVVKGGEWDGNESDTESFGKVYLDGDDTASEETLSQSSTKDQTTDIVITCRKNHTKEQCSPLNHTNKKNQER